MTSDFVRLRLQSKDLDYQDMSHSERLMAKRQELQQLENQSEFRMEDLGGFAIGSLGTGISLKIFAETIKESLTESELQSKASDIMFAARKYAAEFINEDAFKAVLDKHTYGNGGEILEKVKGLTTEGMSSGQAQQWQDMQGHIEGLVKNVSQFGHDDMLNSIQNNFPGGVNGAIALSAALVGLAATAHIMNERGDYNYQRTKDLKQDLTHAELETLRREVDSYRDTDITER